MITVKNAAELTKMRQAGYIVAEALALMQEMIRVGVTTQELNQAAEGLIRRRGAIPCFLGYGGFPATICASVNQQVIHGFPGEYALQEGDIISIDVGAEKNGFCGDAARTFPVGTISPQVAKLLSVTANSLEQAIAKACIGNRLGDISNAVQTTVEENGFSVVREYTGHGIGKKLHEDPAVPNFGPAGRGIRLFEGLTLAIEPMVNMGGYQIVTLADKWTVVTKDQLPSAHFENTVAITADGPLILTSL